MRPRPPWPPRRSRRQRFACPTATDDVTDRKGVIEILVLYPHATTLAVAKEAAALPDVTAEARAGVTTIEGRLAKPEG